MVKNTFRVAKKYSDGSYYSFSRGKIDNWYVQYHTQNGDKSGFKDEEYFARIKELSNRYGKDKVYYSFKKIFDLVTENARFRNEEPIENNTDFEIISEISKDYNYDKLCCEKLFDLLYLTMISEFYHVNKNGKKSELKHRIKLLGIYQVTILDFSAQKAAFFSRGKTVKVIKEEMQKYNI